MISMFRTHRLRMMLVLLSVVIQAAAVCCQGFDWKGQVSSWGTAARSQNDWQGNFGLRYIPQVNYSYPLNDHDLLNTEVLANAFYGTDFRSNDDGAFKLYRAILRYTTAQTETQLGLQKINFGPAQLLRPLMWFDKVDPRDPLKLTDGVYALRYKYSFIDNSIAWVWGLYGNRDPKGYEAYRTANQTPEFGGRFQFPVPAGEAALTLHTRNADAGPFEYRENRYAVDGRWDVGVGLWVESVWQQNVPPVPIAEWNRMTALGGDYTIPEGNGIYLLAEHLFSAASNSFLSTDHHAQVSALMATYPLGVLDNLTVQEYYNWQDHAVYQYYLWQRTYDSFIINCALFHYPNSGGSLFSTAQNSAPGAGYGMQLILVYNY
jgi:hypothetical protein